jgi:4-amino-4-deoxy-L-arabinose transferase-like glycosyltransferase
MVAFGSALCGGLVILYLFFVAVGTVKIGDAIGATVVVLVLALIWLLAYWQRRRTNASVFQRPERERRGF